MKILTRILFFVFLSTVCYACVDSDDVGENFTTFTGKVISTYLEESSEYSEFTAALNKVGALTLLQSYGKYTCFIPTNKAMEAYYAKHGVSLDQMTEKELTELVYYHLIDGEDRGSNAYFTRDFTIGSIASANMTDRYIYTLLESGNWVVNRTTKIISADLEMSNGAVHIIDEVLEGNNDLLPDLVQMDGGFNLFYQALDATGFRDTLSMVEDASYVQPTTLPSGAVQTQRTHYPESKKYGFTILAESDSILKLREGITSLDDLRNYAKSVYRDYTDPDETSSQNSLNRFVAYHIIPAKIMSNRFVNTYGFVSEYEWFSRKNDICYDGKYTIEQYHIPMAPDALISIQKGNIINTHRNVFTENLVSSNEVIRLIQEESDKDCRNGILHSLNNIMVYNDYVEKTVLNKRLRMEFQTFLPELVTNDIIAYKNESNQWHRIIPAGYCANMEFEEKRPSVFVKYSAPNVHHYLYGDEMNIFGFFDVTFMISAIPEGTYEIRIGYRVGNARDDVENTVDRGITQVYFDGEPCGIPIDMRLSATDAGIGWIQDYAISELLGGAAGNIDDPYGYENDKSIRNRGFMKAPDSYVGTVLYNNSGHADTYSTARNSNIDMRCILARNQYISKGKHKLRLKQMLSGSCLLDYIEFMPVELLDKEDQH